MGTNLIPTNVLNLQPPSRICQKQKWIKKIWPRCSLLVSRRNCCLWGKTKHQHWFCHYTTCRRSEPQTFWFLLSVSYLGLLLRLSEECLFMSLGLRGTVKYFQAHVKPGITKRLQNLLITFFLWTIVRGQCCWWDVHQTILANLRIFHAEAELKWKIKAGVVDIPARTSTQQISFDTIDQF